MDHNGEVFDEKSQRVFSELSGESERACAIVGAVYLDDLLGQILEKYLVENTEAYNDLMNPDNLNAPLGAFGARVIAAYALGLIYEDELEVLRKIKRIRNRFAHDLDLSFDDDSIASLCREIAGILEELHYSSDPPTPRDIYQAAIAYQSGRFAEKLWTLETFGISGGFQAVRRTAVELNEARGAAPQAG